MNFEVSYRWQSLSRIVHDNSFDPQVRLYTAIQHILVLSVGHEGLGICPTFKLFAELFLSIKYELKEFQVTVNNHCRFNLIEEMRQITGLLLAGLQSLELWVQILSEAESKFTFISMCKADYCTIQEVI